MSSTNSESESGREEVEEEEEEEEVQRSSEGGEEEGEEVEEEEEEDDEEDGENGHTSQADESVGAGSKRRSSSSAANARLPPKSPASLSTLAFPISRVRRLVKAEVDVQWVGVEAGFLIAKAAELFLENFVEDAFGKMTNDERTVMSYKDLASHVSSSDRFDFLSDFVPETVPASTALSAKGQADR